MANSLTDWLATKVLSPWESSDVSFEKDQDKESLLEDVPYLKGAKVQIVRFFAPQGVSEAEEELRVEAHYDGGSKTAEKSAVLWACVSDRQHFVHVRFSDQCVSRFNSTYSRELISLSGSIIILRKFRPSVSFVPSILENKRNRCGPFAPAQPIHPMILLEIESFEILGSINEVIFWDTKSLQTSLLSDDFAMRNRSFKGWFKQIGKILAAEERRREKRKERMKNGQGSNTPSENRNVADETVSSATTTTASTLTHQTSPYAPPPFQRPSSLPKGPHRSSQSQSKAVSQGSTQAPNPWGSFELSMSSDDDFGIEAAASQILGRQSQSSVNGQEDTGRDQFDPLSISTLDSNSLTDFNTEMLDTLKSSASEQMYSNSKEEAKTLSDPSGSNGVGKGSSNVEDSFLSKSFSLPFSISPGASGSTHDGQSAKPRSDSNLLKEMQHYIADDNVHENEEQSKNKNCDEAKAESELHGKGVENGTQVSDGLNDQAMRIDSGPHEMNDSIPALQISSSSSKTLKGNQSKEVSKPVWDKYIRRPSPEVLKERERTYSSRVSMIVD